jgi:O-antigen/teichoic acid export membrane protein
MIQRLKPKSEFSRNVLTLMTGTTIAQAIPIAITPILTRMYTPEDFGFLALFASLIALLGSIANGRYELAIMLPQEDEDAINIAALGLLIAFVASIILLIPVIFFNDQITSLLDNQEIGFWLYFVPFVVLMTGLHNVLNYLNNRKKLYIDISKAKVYRATVKASVELGFGFIKSGATGLISGQVISQVVANYRLAKNTKEHYDLTKIKKTEIKRLSKRYINFPKFSIWATLANNLSHHTTSIVIPIFYSVATLGFYSLAQRMLGLPSVLIGSAISQVFFKEASDEKQKTGNVINSFDKAVKKLLMISVPFFGLLMVVVEDLFALVFGEEWRIAGIYTMYLIPMFAVRFVVSAVSPVDTVMEKQKYFLYFNVVLMITTLALIFIAGSWAFTNFLMLFSSTVMSVYITYGFILRKMAKNEF